MVARLFSEIELEDPAYREISPNAEIHKTARIEPFCVIDEDVYIGANTLIGPFNHIRDGTVILENCKIGGHNTFEGRCGIGEFTRMGSHCNIGWECYVGHHVFIGGHFTGANEKNISWQRAQMDQKIEGWRIENGARIGLGVILMPGVIIGEEAVIGAKSLVTKSVPSREIHYGNPASFRGNVPESETVAYYKL